MPAAAEHRLEGDGVLALAGELGELPDENLLERSDGSNRVIDHIVVCVDQRDRYDAASVLGIADVEDEGLRVRHGADGDAPGVRIHGKFGHGVIDTKLVITSGKTHRAKPRNMNFQILRVQKHSRARPQQTVVGS